MCTGSEKHLIELKEKLKQLEELVRIKEHEIDALQNDLFINQVTLENITNIALKRKEIIESFKKRSDIYSQKVQALEDMHLTLAFYEEKINLLESRVKNINEKEKNIGKINLENQDLKNKINNLTIQNENLQKLVSFFEQNRNSMGLETEELKNDLENKQKIIQNFDKSLTELDKTLNSQEIEEENLLSWQNNKPVKFPKTIPVPKEAFIEILPVNEIKAEDKSELTLIIGNTTEKATAQPVQSFDAESPFFKNKTFLEKILIVEDDPMTLQLLERFLTKQGFLVIKASSAIEGVEILKAEKFNLVITDINMPEVNGLQFLLWIKQHSPNSQVILITGFGSNEIKNFVNEKGALGYFEKPVNLNELNEFIRNYIAKGFSGNKQDIDLFEFIKIISFSGINKLISVIDPVINKDGLIYLKNGQIIHAESGELTGEEAFYSLIKLQSGIFSDLPWVEPEKSSINSKMADLLKNAAKIKNYESVIQNNPAGTGMIRAKPRYLEKALEQSQALEKFKNESKPLKKLTIYESGVALGIIIGRSNKSDVISAMKTYSKVDGEIQRENQMLFFDDISLTILFNEQDIVEEFNFGQQYLGETSLGIKINDPIEKAIKVYGKPKTCTIKGAVWDNIAFFSMDTIFISSIRMRNLNFFNLNQEMLMEVPDIKLLLPPKEIKGKEEFLDLSEDNALTKKTAKKQKKHKTGELHLPLKKNKNLDETEVEGSDSKTHDDDFTIDETGSVLNIHLGATSMEQVKTIMKKYSSSTGDFKYSRAILAYDDKGLNILFDESGRVKEINFGKGFPGKTSKGLKIGDSIDKAHEIYGPSQYSTNKSAIWEKFSVFGEEPNIIARIRLKIPEKRGGQF
jgi:CheY-like chemotaxis protein